MVFPIAFGGAALLLFVIAAAMTARVVRERSGGERVVGEVIKHGTYTSHGQGMYFPIYRATLPDGRVVEGSATTAMATTWPSPQLGARRGLVHHAGKEPAFSQLSVTPFVPAMILAVFGAGLATFAIVIANAIRHAP